MCGRWCRLYSRHCCLSSSECCSCGGLLCDNSCRSSVRQRSVSNLFASQTGRRAKVNAAAGAAHRGQILLLIVGHTSCGNNAEIIAGADAATAAAAASVANVTNRAHRTSATTRTDRHNGCCCCCGSGRCRIASVHAV